jgi:hypothetical protein
MEIKLNNPNNFQDNWQFSQFHMPTIIDILQSNLKQITKVEIATPEDDMKRSTDIKVQVTGGDVAVRIRRKSSKFRDLTIRAFNKGFDTELHKLRHGYADFYLYLWECEDGSVCDWILVDIGIMRSSGLLYIEKEIKMNYDNTGFVAYSIDELYEYKAIIATSQSLVLL